jgi:L-fuculose-phosphate aldolase
MNDEGLRRQIVETARAVNDGGLSRGTSGNVSARGTQSRQGYLITPSAMPPQRLVAGDVVSIGIEDTPREDLRPRPSTEWRIHRDIYAARPEVSAIVHTHPPFSTSVACLRRDIPPFHYMVAVAGGRDIRCAAYATFGTQELSDNVLAALRDRRACLMANHGMVTVGTTLAEALALAVEVEALAEQYWRAVQMGPPMLLDDAEMDRVLVKIAAYRANAMPAPGAGRG